jgi:osmoprotectant transport system substrate-binding protein
MQSGEEGQMVRKHTRRAAKAAFAVSIGVALLIGLTAGVAGAQRSSIAKKPTIVLGTKNFTEEYILGQLYGQALAAKGFHVVYKGNFGSSELADTAIRAHKMNFYPEYTGIIVLDLAQSKTFPPTAAATYKAAQKYEQKHGLTLLKRTPFVDSDTFTMLTSTAQKDGVKTISDMKKVANFSYAALPECATRITCLLGLKNVYGLTQVNFVPLGAISVYTLLDNEQVTAGDGFTTDPQQNSKKYTRLVDNKHIFGFQNVAPVLSKGLLRGSNGTQLAKICNKVSSLLTIKAMRAMDKAAYVQKATPQAIAHGFLKANGLVK